MTLEGFNPKMLRKIADECRKAGITSFKGFGLELTIAPEAPPSHYKQKKSAQAPVKHYGPEEPEVEGLSEEDRLFWSVGGIEVDVTQKAE